MLAVVAPPQPATPLCAPPPLDSPPATPLPPLVVASHPATLLPLPVAPRPLPDVAQLLLVAVLVWQLT